MPSAAPELQAQWPGGDNEAMGHLENSGYRLTREWTWIPPKADYAATDRDLSAINYLVDEWDFGGVETDLTKELQ